MATEEIILSDPSRADARAKARARARVKKLINGDGEGATEVITPPWLLAPASIEPIKSIKDFREKANAYFTECVELEERATITGFCLAVGLPGPTSLVRLGQRVPELRYMISCCMTAISHGYEQMIGSGNATGPLFMLKNIPDFDPEESIGSPGVQFFNDKKEILLHADVTGSASEGEDYDSDVDPLDIYLSVIKRTDSIGKKATNMNIDLKPDKKRPVYKPTRLLRIIGEVEDYETDSEPGED